MQGLSIRTRLIGLVMVALLPAFAIALWHLHEQDRSARASAYQQARLLTDHTAREIEEELGDAEAMLTDLARHPGVRALDAARCEETLRDIRLPGVPYTLLALLRPDGNAVCSHLAPAPSPADLQAARWFADALPSDTAMISGVVQLPASGRWSVLVTAPVRAAAGDARALLVMGIDVAQLRSRVLAGAPQAALVVVIDQDWRILLRQHDHDARVGRPIPQRFVDHFSSGPEGEFEETSIDGTVRLYAFQTIARTGWRVTAGLPEQQVLAAFRQARTQTIAALLVALAAALGGALLIARSIAAPVQRLAAVAERIAGGDPHPRAAPAGPREVAAVAQQFNRMLDVQAEAERRLADSEARFRALTELSSDWYWEQDSAFRFVSVSPSVQRIVGLSPEAHLGKTRWEVGPLGVSDEALAQHRATLQRHAPFRDFVIERVDAEGARRILAISGEPIFDAAGRFAGYRGTGREITALRRAEDAARAREAQYRALIERLPAGVVVHAPDTSVLLANRAACDLLGLTVDQIHGRAAPHPDWRFVREDGTPMPLEEYPVMRVLASGQPVHDLIGGIDRGDGSERAWVFGQAFPEHDAQGQLVRIVVTFADITALKKAEQLHAERDAAALASRSKSEFLSRVSHELRTPLNSILGFGQLLQLDPAVAASPSTAERVSHVVAAGRHLLAMVNDILDLTQAESGALALALEAVDVAALARSCAALVQPQASERALTIDVVAVDGVAHADPNRLRQVLMNLLSNAIKYNRHGGRVTVTVESDTRSVHLAVGDTGPGLTAEQQARLFQPFNRLGAEQSGIEGTGLGLVIARLLMLAMGGDIEVQSAPGAGSRFILRLPRAAGGAPAIAGGAAQTATAAPLRALRVLCIEDDPSSLALACSVVGMLPQVQLLTATDGAQGLAIAQRERPDLVLLDLNLPQLDGYEVLRRLRADPATAAIRCVALTANAMPADVERIRAAGFEEHITKPFDVAALLARLRDWAAAGHR
jgi:PAS domain S-box-containing protein